MAWKDYLQFGTGERIGIFVLLGIILISIVAPFVYRWAVPQKTIDLSKFEEAVVQFEAKIEESRMAREAERESRRTWQRPNRDWDFSRNEPVILNPFRFNPNRLPIAEWKRMGIPDQIANRIHNYENAGGSFRFKEDLARIYAITDEIYKQLEPFIDLPSRKDIQDRQVAAANGIEGFSRERISPEVRMVELNSADSATLVTVSGIGPAFSRRIIRYRERLGGFVDVTQLLEVFGMDTTRFNQIKGSFYIDPNLISGLKLNSSTWEELVRHPYINSNIANSIIALRRQHGPFRLVEDLKKSKLISDSLFYRLHPYLLLD